MKDRIDYWVYEDDEVTYCRTCETETNGETYCSQTCSLYDLE